MEIRKPNGVEKLPARFRDYVQTLENRVRELEGLIAEGPKDSRLSLVDGLNERAVEDTYAAQFLFKMQELARPVWIRAKLAGEFSSGRDKERASLEISGERGLDIIPASSNLFYVRPRLF